MVQVELIPRPNMSQGFKRERTWFEDDLEPNWSADDADDDEVQFLGRRDAHDLFVTDLTNGEDDAPSTDEVPEADAAPSPTTCVIGMSTWPRMVHFTKWYY